MPKQEDYNLKIPQEKFVDFLTDMLMTNQALVMSLHSFIIEHLQPEKAEELEKYLKENTHANRLSVIAGYMSKYSL